MRYLDFLDSSRFTLHIRQFLTMENDERVEAEVFIDNQTHDCYQVVNSRNKYRRSPYSNGDEHDYGEWIDLII